MRQTTFALLLLLLATPVFAQSSDLSVQITESADPVLPDAPLTYTITASNSGPGAVPNAVLTIDRPADTSTFNSFTPAPGWNCSGPVPPSRLITCTSASFPVGSATFTLSLTSPEVPGSTSATATISSGNADPNPANDTATQTTTITSPASINGVKSIASGGVTAGTNVVYSIVLTNSGATGTTDATGDELLDMLQQPQLTLVSANATSGTAVADIPNNRVRWNGGIAAGASVTITITAFVQPSAAGTTVTNQASFTYDRNNDGTNDTTGITNPVTFTPAPAGNAAAVPTASSWGLIVMAAVLAGIGLMRR